MQQAVDRLIVVSKPEAGKYFSSCSKPYLESALAAYINFDSLTDFKNRDSALLSRLNCPFISFIWKKFRNENLFSVKSSDINLTIDPLFNFGFGSFSTSDKNLNYNSTYINTRGAIISGKLGKKVAFFSTVYENQGRFIDYIDAFIKKSYTLPGEGVAKQFKDNANQYDYSSATGLISYSPSSHLNFLFGNAKNFIGDGYRSLLLSDNSFNYPFLKIKAALGRIEYSNLYASFQVPKPRGESLYTRKYATYHILSMNILKGLEISLFESTVWQAKDENKSIPFKVKYLNPLIGLQSLAYGLTGENNSMLGINLSFDFLCHHLLYSQIAIDDINTSGKGKYNNKFGLQLGYKYFDVFNLKNLYFQTEYNSASPFIYAHKDSLQSYSHYNQALAHPIGANFRESVTFINYRFRDFLFELKFNFAVFGADTGNYNFGNDIFKSQNPDKYIINMSGASIGDGLKNTIVYKSFRIYFLLNPVTNMNLYLEISDRKQTSEYLNYHSTYIFFGFKTSLNNLYYDF
jgi:hypothetical protein